MNRVTLKQLADILGLSTGTVSKALKDYYDISPETKRRVKELAEKLNYVPNALAVNFRTKETKTIGLIIPEVVHHFFSNVIKGIIEEAEKLNYLVIILPSNESFELEKKQLNLLVSKQVDGIIMSLANKTIDYKHINEVIDKNIPVILFDKISKLVKCSKIIIDDRKAAYNATNHLIKTGCKKIAHIRGPLEPQNSIDRFLGYKKALDENNIEYLSNFVYTCDEVSFEEGYQFAEQIIKDHPDIDGIFAITDLVATGVITKLNELNIKIPEQVSVIGFSDWFLSRAITPSLTTIYQPGLEIGKNCFSQLIKEIQFKKNNTNYNYETITLPTSLIVRNSTKTI
ncbi:LacI family DNA-binding transcriptional regulator [Tenacibaculum geojense]|uniref:LacI family DNA-binding transcriptional regulator n=1 Tax=Tenacibaculum geojense TaxID=915352 RepID=A0ABW3JX53_9FLAO